jgi:signal transduction histidine kinase
MRRVFLRIYAALFALLGISAALLAVLAPKPPKLDVETQVAGYLGKSTEEVRAVLGKAESAEAASAALSMPVAWLPAEAVSSSIASYGARLLAEGRPVVLAQAGGPAIYVPLQAGRVAVLRPQPGAPPFSRRRGLVVVGILLVALGAAIYLAVRPLETQLRAMADTAERIGRGDLAARSGVRGEGAVQRLAARFDAMAAEVQRMVDGRKALLHGVSHELRTPLSRMRFGLELLEDDPVRRAAQVADLERDLDELDALVGELLRFVALEGGSALQREPVDLRELLHNVAEDARRVRPGLTVEVVIGASSGSTVHSLDRRLAARTLHNLANNAARHATTRVELGLASGDGAVTIVVDDDGPGVPALDRERIFEPFVRLDGARSRDQGGIGLGLALARRAVEAHGGRLTVGDAPLGGARFRWEFAG